MGSQAKQLGYLPNNVQTGDAACEGRKSITTIIDFNIGLNFSLDLTSIQQMQNWIRSVQCLYIDNADNAFAITLTMGVTNQRVIVPANSQGYYPVLQPNPPVLQFVSGSVGTLKIQILNFFLPPYIWTIAAGGGATIPVADAILDATVVNGRVRTTELPGQVALTDRSGTIAVAATGQSLMAANPGRLKWNLQNPSNATEKLQFSYFSIAGPWYDLTPGAEVEETECVYAGQVWVIAATAAHAFTAAEG